MHSKDIKRGGHFKKIKQKTKHSERTNHDIFFPVLPLNNDGEGGRKTTGKKNVQNRNVGEDLP
jgi:hypothetical protein